MTTTRVAIVPPRFDLTLVLLVAMALAAGVAFFAICKNAGADEIKREPTTWGSAMIWQPTEASTLSVGYPTTTVKTLKANDVHVAGTLTATAIDVDQITTRGIGLKDANNRLDIAMEDGTRLLLDHDGLRINGGRVLTEWDLAAFASMSILFAVAVSGLFGLLGLTLFSRAFALRRWVARAHRSMLRKMASDPGASPAR
jgi:hypothetical protein